MHGVRTDGCSGAVVPDRRRHRICVAVCFLERPRKSTIQRAAPRPHADVKAQSVALCGATQASTLRRDPPLAPPSRRRISCPAGEFAGILAGVVCEDAMPEKADNQSASLPTRVPRSEAAALVTRYFFRVSPRTLERWPVVVTVVNGRARTSRLLNCCRWHRRCWIERREPGVGRGRDACVATGPRARCRAAVRSDVKYCDSAE